jgi:hypothetical protein
MMKFNIALSYPDTNENFAEVMNSVAQGLRALGHQVTTVNRFQRGVVNIIFGFYIHPDMPLEKSIIYQLEPVDDFTLHNGHVPATAMRQHIVWDYSRHNVQRLQEAGTSAIYVPIGCPSIAVTSVPQDIDVLFYGAMHLRRTQIVDALRQKGLKVVSEFGVFGGRLDSLISRAKVVLNMHGSSLHRTFESVRVARILAHHRAVVSEVNIGDDTDGFGGSVLGVPYPSLVDACIYLVKNEDRRTEYADAGFGYIHTRDESAILRRALEETYGQH